MSDQTATPFVLRDMPPRDPVAVAASLLESAARILRRIEAGTYSRDHLGSAAWRTADALVYMADVAEQHNLHEVMGIHEPTGLQSARGVKR